MLNDTKDLFRPGFSTAEAASAAGLTTDTLRTWADRGFIGASDKPGTGHGRKYSAEFVVHLAIMGRLSDFGVPPSVMLKLSSVFDPRLNITQLGSIFESNKSSWAIVWRRSTVENKQYGQFDGQITVDPDVLFAQIKEHPVCFVLDMRSIFDRVIHNLRQLPRK